MTAFGLVVALAWKDTINATVTYLMPDNDDGTLKGMYITAVAVTLLVMGLAILVLKLNTRVEKEIERVQSYFDDGDDEDGGDVADEGVADYGGDNDDDHDDGGDGGDDVYV